MKIYYGEPHGFTGLFAVILAVLSPFVPDFYKFLLNEFPFLGAHQPTYSVAFILAVFCVIATLVAFSAGWLYRFHWYRRLCNDPMAKLEGHWIQYTGIEERPYSFSKFEYSYPQRRYCYSGDAINHNNTGRSFGFWQTANVMFDAQENRVIFFSEHAAVGQERAREEVYNFGWLHAVDEDRFGQLEGEVRDFTKRSEPFRPHATSFEISYMKKLSRKQIKKTLGKSKPETIEDKHKLVLAFMPQIKLAEGKELSKTP